jgi:uncharacterized protein (TIGR02246 family)
MRTLSTLAALGIVLLWTACQQAATEQGEATESVVDLAAEEQAIQDLGARYEQAIAAKDADALAAFYTDDAVWTTHDGTTIEGPDAIREFYQPVVTAEGTASMEIHREATVIAASGDVAHEYGSYTSTMTTPEGEASSQTVRYVVLFRKVDGEWKVAGGMDTAPIAPPGAAAP